MKVLKKSVIIILLTILTLAMSTFISINKSDAAGVDDVHIKVEVSKDNVNWYNYSGTEYNGGQTLTLNAGESFWMRVKIWNTSGDYNVSGTGSISTIAYFNPIPEFDIDLDADHNLNSFTTNYFIGGTGSINNVTVVSEGTAEALTVKASLISSVPADTVITGTANITSAVEPDSGPGQAGFLGIGKAQAQMPRHSAFRIMVNQTLPRTGAD
jgi:hypothetical protein